MRKSGDLTSGSLPKAILGMTVPIVAGNVLQTGYNLIDTLFVSKIGDTEVAAVTFIMPIALTILSLAHGLSTAGLSLVSQSTGAGKKNNTVHYAAHILIMGLGPAVLIGVAGYLWSGLILSSLQLTGNLLHTAREYLAYIFLATPFTFFNVIYGGIRSSEGFARKTLTVQVISLCLNVFLNYIFIFELSLGIRGAALATLCARAAAALYGGLDLIIGRQGCRIRWKDFEFSWTTTALVYRLGIPAALNKGSISVGFIILNMLIADFGDGVLAAFGIGSRINSIFFMPSSGFGLALSVVVGQNIGAGKIDRSRRAVKQTLLFSMLFSIFGAAVLYNSSLWLARAFSNNAEVIRHAMNYMRLVAITVIPWGVFQVMTGVFQGAGYTGSAMIISLVRLWVLRIPILLLLKHYTALEESSIWYSMFISNVLTAVVSVVLYFIVPWERGVKDLHNSKVIQK